MKIINIYTVSVLAIVVLYLFVSSNYSIDEEVGTKEQNVNKQTSLNFIDEGTEKDSLLNDELNIIEDPETGCQYIIYNDDSLYHSGQGAIIPRYNNQGKIQCK